MIRSKNYQLFNQQIDRKAFKEMILIHQYIMKKKLYKKFDLIHKFIYLLKNDFINLIKKNRKISKSDFYGLSLFDK